MKFAEWIKDQDVLGVTGAGDGARDGDGPEVLHMTSDSREVKPGWAFVALKGERKDGADFVPAALEAGAVAILGDRDLVLPALVPFARLG
jgi:UDP-N-acetylmuramoyl-L-alanyl-D-glutamate--2,6-diaminopimelate ligase